MQADTGFRCWPCKCNILRSCLARELCCVALLPPHFLSALPKNIQKDERIEREASKHVIGTTVPLYICITILIFRFPSWHHAVFYEWNKTQAESSYCELLVCHKKKQLALVTYLKPQMFSSTDRKYNIITCILITLYCCFLLCSHYLFDTRCQLSTHIKWIRTKRRYITYEYLSSYPQIFQSYKILPRFSVKL